MTVDLASTEESERRESRLAALSVLTQQVRDLMDATALTDVDEEEISAVTAELVALTDRLSAARRDRPQPHEIAPDGRFRHLGNAVTGACNPYAIPVEMRLTPEGGVRSDLTFRPIHEGPPNFVHGGVTAMVLDNLLGSAVAASGNAGMTGTLTIRYRHPTPYGRPLVGTAEVSRVEGRKTWADGRIATPDGTVLVEATGLFITPNQWTRPKGTSADPA